MSPNGILDESFFVRPNQGQSFSFPILVVGGSTAAYSATLGALQAGATVCLVQPQLVLGGQFTAQALPASDDGRLMSTQPGISQVAGETFAISRTQRQFRQRQREGQKINGQMVSNPGGGWVSNFAVTPVVAANALDEMLETYINLNQLTLIPLAKPKEVLIDESPGRPRRVTGVVFQDVRNNRQFSVNAEIVIEATDLGDLLELGNIESRVGQESRNDTGEAILSETAFPMCQQAFTFCAVVEKTPPGSGVPINAPEGYEREPWLKAEDFTSIFWVKRPNRNPPWERRDFLHPFGIFTYRRLQRLRATNAASNGDVTVINWGTSPRGSNGDPPQNESGEPLHCGNDYNFGALVGVSREERQRHLQQARARAQAYAHFLQVHGEENLKPRGDLTWTDDGIALEPYIREARRGVALTTIRHEDVAEKFFPNAARARSFEDSVGIGQYHYLDIHPNDAAGHVDLGDANIALPFTIPLGALIPVKTDGLILSAKSIGTTHITNAAYRMHPVEWAIGEAGGHLAAFALREGVAIREIAADEKLKRQLQGLLAQNGIPLFWFNDLGHDDPDFEAIQVMAVADIVPQATERNLQFDPQGVASRAVVAVALVKVLGLSLVARTTPTFIDVPRSHFAYQSIETLYSNGITVGIGNQRFAPERPCTRQQLSIFISKVGESGFERVFLETPQDSGNLRRRELSRVLYRVLRIKLGLTI